MRKAKKIPDYGGESRPKLNVQGIGRLFGISRRTMYYRLEKGSFSLEGISVVVKRTGNFYDMEEVFRRVFPMADDNKIAELMFIFMRDNGGLVK